MFDRYTDRARGCIYYARVSVSQYGSAMLDTEHLLLGILQVGANLIGQFLPSKTTDDIRAEIERRMVVKPEIPTHIDIPLSTEGQQILTFALEEADTWAIVASILRICW